VVRVRLARAPDHDAQANVFCGKLRGVEPGGCVRILWTDRGAARWTAPTAWGPRTTWTSCTRRWAAWRGSSRSLPRPQPRARAGGAGAWEQQDAAATLLRLLRESGWRSVVSARGVGGGVGGGGGRRPQLTRAYSSARPTLCAHPCRGTMQWRTATRHPSSCSRPCPVSSPRRPPEPPRRHHAARAS